MKTKLTKLTSVLLCLVLSLGLFGGLTVNGFDWSAVEDDSFEDEVPIGAFTTFYIIADSSFEQSGHISSETASKRLPAQDGKFLYIENYHYNYQYQMIEEYERIIAVDGVADIFSDDVYRNETGNSVYASGDVDGDTKVTASDALACLQYVVGKRPIPSARVAFDADYEWDYTLVIDTTDALAILQKAVGKK